MIVSRLLARRTTVVHYNILLTKSKRFPQIKATRAQTLSELTTMSRFDDVTDKLNFPEAEEKVLAYWKEIDAFKTSIELSKGRPEYTFYDGPPFATGLPHYG